MFHQNVDICDQCLAVGLGVSDREAAAITAELGSSPAFLRDRWTCCRCGRTRRVIRGLSDHTLSVRGRLKSRWRGPVDPVLRRAG